MTNKKTKAKPETLPSAPAAQTENPTTDGQGATEGVAPVEATATDPNPVPAEPTVPDPSQPSEVVGESSEEAQDRHVASHELPVGELMAEDAQQFDGPAVDEANQKIVPGAATAPDASGTIRNDQGKVAYAPPGSMNAAMNGVQEDASGHVSSVGTDNSSASGVRTYP